MSLRGKRVALVTANASLRQELERVLLDAGALCVARPGGLFQALDCDLIVADDVESRDIEVMLSDLRRAAPLHRGIVIVTDRARVAAEAARSGMTVVSGRGFRGALSGAVHAAVASLAAKKSLRPK